MGRFYAGLTAALGIVLLMTVGPGYARRKLAPFAFAKTTVKRSGMMPPTECWNPVFRLTAAASRPSMPRRAGHDCPFVPETLTLSIYVGFTDG